MSESEQQPQTRMSPFWHFSPGHNIVVKPLLSIRVSITEFSISTYILHCVIEEFL